MNNENFQNKEEILSGDDAKVSALLGGLPRVDAPNDFDFRLKARIAASHAKDFEPRAFPALRAAAPLALALVVLAIFVIGGIYSVNNNSVPQVAGDVPMPNENKNSRPEEIAVSTENAVQNTEEKDKPKDAELAANLDKPKKDAPAENNNGGSLDSVVREPNVVLPGGFETKTSVAVKDVLEIIGIEASFSNKKWRVRSVRANTPAERKGVKAGDTVEAINDIALPAGTITLNGPFTGKKLTLARDGAKIEIDLQNR